MTLRRASDTRRFLASHYQIELVEYRRSKDLFSAFGTFILERLATAGPSFLASPRNEAKEGDPTKHAGPSSADNRAAAAELASLKQSSPKPRPLVPRFGVLQGEI
ncbi:hypothetical protein C1H71_05730 [Iodobacter fluviatilis]|uniref:Uncharacterized protein n=1 Tax=Iodobacter fluviatilis TaxID=537 RepID=A0A7G3G714_9NEIS|nr:hypothetical protein C1H71_05730 [Iodobacter fluviatilis]